MVGVKCETYPFAYKQTNTTFTNGFKGTGDSDVVIDENLMRKKKKVFAVLPADYITFQRAHANTLLFESILNMQRERARETTAAD